MTGDVLKSNVDQRLDDADEATTGVDPDAWPVRLVGFIGEWLATAFGLLVDTLIGG